MSVTRYEPTADDWGVTYMEMYDSGDWVKFDNYEQLASEYDDLKEKYGTLVAKIYGVYMEA